MKGFLLATAVLMSTIVGVGIFSLPYAGAQSGFLIAAIFLFILAGIMTLLHLLYGEIVSRTKEKHRLVGYAGHYLGKWGRGIVALSVFIGFYGSLLVYIIVGGDFLAVILSPLIVVPSIIFNLIFFIIGSIAVYFGLRLIAELDFFMGLFLILIILLIFSFGLSYINLDNFKHINIRNLFFPYGAILYSLAGMAAIPEIKELIRNKKHYSKAIIIGTLIPAFLYLVFMFSVIGLTGGKTSSEAISGLINVLGNKIVFLGSLFGFLACLTSFFILGLSLKKTFLYDFKFNKNIAWFLVCIIPFLLFVLGMRNFIYIIVILGALMGAIEGSSIVLIYKKAKKFGNQVPDYELKLPEFLRYIIILVFILGFVYTIISII